MFDLRSPPAAGHLRMVFVAGLGIALGNPATPAAAQQPEVVCDLTPVLVGSFSGPSFVRRDMSLPEAAPLRFTFRDINPKAGTAKLLVAPDTFEQPVAVTVEQGAITYLQEQPNVGKLIIATQTKPTDQGWPAIMSQHGWTAEGGLSVRTATGMCRMLARN